MAKEITKEEIMEEFSKGINCSQFVVRHFADKLGLDKDLLTRLASGFEWGMEDGRICGAVTGAYMVLGLKYGNGDGPINDEAKEKKVTLTKKMKEFDERFKQRNSSVACKDLLGNKYPEEVETIFEKNSLQVACPKAVFDSIEILEELI
ncbi:MAG: C-GCAxxG-C-C family protein [Finegoldia sp.]|nr:C-GCAxxG-C-C family protein [Finegoldia sp.]